MPKQEQKQVFQTIYICILVFLACLIGGMVYDGRGYDASPLQDSSAVKMEPMVEDDTAAEEEPPAAGGVGS